ncbi:uncharacterized protein LOC135703777 [Ochlerotatus camptorhynchus]|uniref:uncharacterized protein LOC135703777 n=1 Tax=Ochlerotatus camptorhynchus TaxID=644619 RepID=UPI0031DBF3C9
MIPQPEFLDVEMYEEEAEEEEDVGEEEEVEILESLDDSDISEDFGDEEEPLKEDDPSFDTLAVDDTPTGLRPSDPVIIKQQTQIGSELIPKAEQNVSTPVTETAVAAPESCHRLEPHEAVETLISSVAPATVPSNFYPRTSEMSTDPSTGSPLKQILTIEWKLAPSIYKEA